MQVARRQRTNHQIQPRGAQHEQLRRELRPEQIIIVPVQRQNVAGSWRRHRNVRNPTLNTMSLTYTQHY